MQTNIYLHKTSNAASTMAASDAPRTFHTMGELSRYYDEKFRALREEGRRIHENYVENRRKLNEQRRREGASPEKYRHRFSLLRERYYSQGRDIWLRRLSLGSKYCHDEAKFSLELEKKKRKEKEARKLDAEYSPIGRVVTFLIFILMIACTIFMIYTTVTTPGCENTPEKVIHVLFFGCLDIFFIMGTYVWWQKLTYSRERWEKNLEKSKKFLEEQKLKKDIRNLRPRWFDTPSPGITD